MPFFYFVLLQNAYTPHIPTMNRFYVALLLGIFSSVAAGAQTYTIKGSVFDTLNAAPLARASITVIRLKDTVIESFSRAAANGAFQVNVATEGKYTVQITFPSFADYVDKITVNKAVTDLGQIALVSKEHLLKEFVLKKQVAAIKIKGDTTEYMADSFKVKENATVEDLLKKLPGIQVDKNGAITAQGQTVAKVLVDGEEFFSDDPKVVTKGLQANAVEKVQVYDKKSDQAIFTGIDDGEKAKTINLTLKEDKKKGFFGKIEAGAGNAGYFQNQAMVNAFRGKRQFAAFGIASNTDKVGLGWEDNGKFGGGGGTTEITDEGYWMTTSNNYDDFGGWSGQYSGNGLPKAWTGGVHFADKWNKEKNHISANYRYAQQNVEIDGANITVNALNGDTLRKNTEQSHQFNTAERHGVDLLYELKIDSNTSLRFTANAGTKDSRSVSLNTTETLNLTPDEGPKTTNNRTTTNLTNAQFINSDLLFRHKFAKKGRTMSVDVKENYSISKGEGHLNSTLTNPSAPAPTIIDQKKINDNNSLAFSTKATYTEPLSKVAFAEVSYALTINNSDALNSSYDKAPGSRDYTTLRDSFSSNYRYNIMSNIGGLNFKFVYKKMNFGFGTEVSNAKFLQTDLLHGDTSHTYNYLNLFPKANFTYKLGKQTSFSFSYNGSTKQPTITQIQPLNQNTDPLNITVGNPGLKQQFTNRFNLRFNDYKVLSGRYLWSGLTLNTIADAISTTQTVSGPVSTTRYINVDGNYSGYAYGGYGFKISKLDMRLDLSLNVNVDHINSVINNIKNVSDNNSYTFGPQFRKEKEDKYEFSWEPSVTYNDNRSTINNFSTNYWVLNNQLNAQVQLPKKLEIGSTADIMIRQKTIAFTTNNEIIKWNAYVSKKFLKQSQLELKLSVYDILNQNTGYTRTAEGSSIYQNSYNTIRRYGMLSLLWNFTHNPAGAATTEN